MLTKHDLENWMNQSQIAFYYFKIRLNIENFLFEGKSSASFCCWFKTKEDQRRRTGLKYIQGGSKKVYESI